VEVVGDLNLNVVEHDAQKALLHLRNAIWTLMVEKVELDHLISELIKTSNFQDFVKPCYQLQKLKKYAIQISNYLK
jgi:hypothetical protein